MAILFASQCLGMFVLKISDTPQSGVARVDRWHSAKTFVAGSLLGIAWILFVAALTFLPVLCIALLLGILRAGLYYPVQTIAASALCAAFVAIMLMRKKTPD